jgi:hypothetical protein
MSDEKTLQMLAEQLNYVENQLRWAAPSAMWEDRPEWDLDKVADALATLTKAVGALAGLKRIVRYEHTIRETEEWAVPTKE